MKKNNQLSHIRTWIEVDKKAIKKNYQSFRSITPKNCRLMSVVKSNAYGHGLIDFSKEMEKLGIDWLGVDSSLEAFTLRNEGIKKPILVLGYTPKENIPEAVRKNVSITVSSFSHLKDLFELDLKKTIKIHLKIDTGMHRQGFLPNELPKLLKELKEKKECVAVEGIYTHFANAKKPQDLNDTKKQFSIFQKTTRMTKNAGFNPIKHAASTGGALIFPESKMDMMRIGIGLYGLWPSEKIKKRFAKKIILLPAITWKTIISEIKKIPKKEGIGYNFTVKTSKKSKIAILPIGYWHGYNRLFSNKAEVEVLGKKARILGIVSMDMVIIDVTDIRGVKTKNEVVLMGKNITADSLAKLAQTVNYEIITRLNSRIKRIYL